MQLTTLVTTAVAFLLAVDIPGALGDAALWFAVPYVVVRAIGLSLYYAVARHDPAQLRAVRVFSLLSLSGLAAVIVGALAGGGAQYVWWALAIALDLTAAGVGGQLEGWNLHPDHFAERHGLIVIIALGETLIVAAAGLTGAIGNPSAVATAVSAVAVTCGLWWSYFRRARQELEHALRAREGHARSCLARDVFSVIHFPMLCGVIALAAGMHYALAHPDGVLPLSVRLALGAGTALFVCGTGLALWRATGRVLVPRCVLGLAGLAVVLGITAIPWAALTTLFALLAALAMIEHRDAGWSASV